MKLYLILIIFLTTCKTTKVYKPTIADLNTRLYKEVSLQDLLQNKGLYHGQYIRTKGFLHIGFEERAIYYDMAVSLGDTTIKNRDYCGLWLEFNVNDLYHQSLPDSLKDKFVMVKGYFDTTKNGHVGGCYRAELSNAQDLIFIQRD